MTVLFPFSFSIIILPGVTKPFFSMKSAKMSVLSFFDSLIRGGWLAHHFATPGRNLPGASFALPASLIMQNWKDAGYHIPSGLTGYLPGSIVHRHYATSFQRDSCPAGQREACEAGYCRRTGAWQNETARRGFQPL